MSMSKKEPSTNSISEQQVARQNWQRYEYARMRGHREYCAQARCNENFYLGGGRQWDAADRQALEAEGRPALEFNQIKHKVNTAIGYQIQNRMDVAFRPRGQGADEGTAAVLSKVAMQVADNTGLHWLETQVFADGLIQQRGYFDIRVSYQDSMLGEVCIVDLDPMDVLPDPDSKSYDPDSWQDVIVTRWLTYDEIETLYGSVARERVEQSKPEEGDFGDEAGDEARNKFGDASTGYTDYSASTLLKDGSQRARVIERQFWAMEDTEVAISLTGDIRPVAHLSAEQRAALQGVVFSKRRIRRVRWVISTYDRVLHDDWSPFNHFTVVPFFPYFRRGKTCGLIDDAIGPQQLLNKTMSQFLHIINTTANSGWIWWANSLANLRDDEMSERGAETGLNIALRADTPPEKRPQKIQPNQIPTGLDRIIERASMMLDETTGINDAMTGQAGREVSGVAIQSRQFAAQQGLAVPLDNLARTRNLLARRLLELIQGFYDEPRLLRITEHDPKGKPRSTELAVNQEQPDGSILNDLTLGEYDVVVTEQPMQITFNNSQFVQLIEMRDKGVAVPDSFVVKHSSLADKHDIMDAMEQQAQQQADPLTAAKVALAEAQARKTLNEAVNKSVEAQYSAMQAAGVIAATPATSPLADALLRSAGYQDQDAAPIVPTYDGAPAIPLSPPANPTNTSPLTPANPGMGLNTGIETSANDGVPPYGNE